ncbi:MAG: hypothetical protein OET44_07245 [Gammaproteobacteria bacterium]|nr:hypothetical protein [Gammaproteobacteria bacterium]
MDNSVMISRSRHARGALCAVGLMLLLLAPAAHGDGLYLSLGVGAVGENDLVDYENESVHTTPVGRAQLSYQMNVNPYVTLATTLQHFSSLQADDGGMNWAGMEVGIKF